MRAINEKNLAAIENSVIIPRDLMTIKIKRLDDGSNFEYGFWSGSENINAEVMNPQTGRAVTRQFEGVGTLISMSDLTMQIGLRVQAITVSLSQLHDATHNFLHTYSFKQGIVEIFRGFLDEESRQLVAPAECRFFGYINEVVENIPKSGDDGSIDLTCNSHSQEITRFNTSTRSNADQQIWFSGDNFCQDTTVVGTIEHVWGREYGKITTANNDRIGMNFNTLANV